MTIIGTGIDIVSVRRVREKIQKNSLLADRIFTSRELVYCRSKKNPYPCLAARVAAKEAVYKVLGNMIKGLYWKGIEIVAKNSVPAISSDCKAGKYMSGNNIDCSLTISHEQEFAVAQALFWRKE